MNAMKELLEHTNGKQVEFVSIVFNGAWDKPDIFIKGTLEEVLPRLDFEYDAGFGSQELGGFIWYADRTWSDRYEYDGSEHWVYQSCPSRDADLEALI